MGIAQFNFSSFFNNKINASIKSEDFKTNFNRFAIPVQSHSSNVKFITKPGIYKNIDGLITSKKHNIILTIKVADCVPIYIYDPIKKYYGLIHSGWRGTRDHIIINAIQTFFDIAKSDPKNLILFIGPHIKQCCYEIDWDVAQYFSCIKKKKSCDKWILSLKNEIINDAIKKGLLLSNIHSSNICTYESLDCESFRRDGKHARRMMGVIY